MSDSASVRYTSNQTLKLGCLAGKEGGLSHPDVPTSADPRPAGPSLEQFEKLAGDIVNAYQSGDAGAMQRIRDYLGQMFSPDEFRARLRWQLGIPANSVHSFDLTLADAQYFVARGHGFESWADLVEHMSPASREDIRRR